MTNNQEGSAFGDSHDRDNVKAPQASLSISSPVEALSPMEPRVTTVFPASAPPFSTTVMPLTAFERPVVRIGSDMTSAMLPQVPSSTFLQYNSKRSSSVPKKSVSFRLPGQGQSASMGRLGKDRPRPPRRSLSLSEGSTRPLRSALRPSSSPNSLQASGFSPRFIPDRDGTLQAAAAALAAGFSRIPPTLPVEAISPLETKLSAPEFSHLPNTFSEAIKLQLQNPDLIRPAIVISMESRGAPDPAEASMNMHATSPESNENLVTSPIGNSASQPAKISGSLTATGDSTISTTTSAPLKSSDVPLDALQSRVVPQISTSSKEMEEPLSPSQTHSQPSAFNQLQLPLTVPVREPEIQPFVSSNASDDGATSQINPRSIEVPVGVRAVDGRSSLGGMESNQWGRGFSDAHLAAQAQLMKQELLVLKLQQLQQGSSFASASGAQPFPYHLSPLSPGYPSDSLAQHSGVTAEQIVSSSLLQQALADIQVLRTLVAQKGSTTSHSSQSFATSKSAVPALNVPNISRPLSGFADMRDSDDFAMVSVDLAS